MHNDDERDYAEEVYNRATMHDESERDADDNVWPDANTRADCVDCGQQVRYVDGVMGGAWQHTCTMSVYCTLAGDQRAEATA